jgi:hypothetical protein
MAGDVVASPPIGGAGRRYSYLYPIPKFLSDTSVPSADEIFPRATSQSTQSRYVNGVTGVPPTPQGARVYNGRPAFQMTADQATGRVLSPNLTSGNRWPMHWFFQTDQGASNPAIDGLDDFQCWRVSAIMAFQNPAAAIVGNVGISLCPGLNTSPRLLLQPGLVLGPIGPNAIGVAIVQTAGVAPTFDGAIAAAAQPADLTDWNHYEIRVVGASQRGHARVTVYVNGLAGGSWSWGPGTILFPNYDVVSGLMGCSNAVLNRTPYASLATGGYSAYLAIAGMEVVGAPTEAALL